MTVTTGNILVAVLFIAVGWMLKTVWDAVVDWVLDVFGGAGGILWDACALVGVLAVCVGVGFGVQHWLTG